MPKRIQRKRTKGWKMPENAIYIGRPTVWGNRWKIGTYSKTLRRPVETLEEAVAVWRSNQIDSVSNAGYRAFIKERLRGKDLACWCPVDKPCHGDVLLEIANS